MNNKTVIKTSNSGTLSATTFSTSNTVQGEEKASILKDFIFRMNEMYNNIESNIVKINSKIDRFYGRDVLKDVGPEPEQQELGHTYSNDLNVISEKIKYLSSELHAINNELNEIIG